MRARERKEGKLLKWKTASSSFHRALKRLSWRHDKKKSFSLLLNDEKFNNFQFSMFTVDVRKFIVISISIEHVWCRRFIVSLQINVGWMKILKKGSDGEEEEKNFSCSLKIIRLSSFEYVLYFIYFFFYHCGCKAKQRKIYCEKGRQSVDIKHFFFLSLTFPPILLISNFAFRLCKLNHDPIFIHFLLRFSFARKSFSSV